MPHFDTTLYPLRLMVGCMIFVADLCPDRRISHTSFTVEVSINTGFSA